jgi:adenosyl cobinamide kinase/adenosyl cobinamide phosphate guanylyltransferase
MGFVLLLGGARSGKSSLAVRLAADSGAPVTFIATAAPGDAEMADRIRVHREERPAGWTTIDAPIDLLAAISAEAPDKFLVVDCLTLWVSNLLGKGAGADEVKLGAGRVADSMARRRGVVVSNEVGLGIVPANDLARAFRDVLGSVNARFAERAERALFLVAGRAIELSAASW